MPQVFPGAVHKGPHAGDTLGETHEQGLADEVMTDIELDDLGNRGDRDDIIIIETVAGMDLEPGSGGCLGAGDEAVEFAPERRSVARLRRRAIGAGVQLDGVGARPRARLRSARARGR